MSSVFPTFLAALLKPSSGVLNASDLMFTDNGSSFFVLHWKKWENVRNEAIDTFVRLMGMAGALSPGSFGAGVGRILECIAKASVLDGCRSRGFVGTTAFLPCNLKVGGLKQKRKKPESL